MTPEPPVVLTLHGALEKLCEAGLARDLRLAEHRLQELLREQVGKSSTEMNSVDLFTIDKHWQRHRAYSALQNDLVDRIERGEFHLYGSKVSATGTDAVVFLTCTDVHRGSIKPAANTIERAGETYTEVHAVLGPFEATVKAERRRLVLQQAVSRWCDPWLLIGVRRNESVFRTDEILDFGFPQLSLACGAKREARRLSAEEYAVQRRCLETSWRGLLKDLQTRVAAEEIYLYGVQTQPNLATDYERIPATWAFDLQVDAKNQSVTAHGRRWTAVECWLDPADVDTKPAEQASPAPAAQASFATLKPEDVYEFSDDLILALLEENHRRVVGSPDVRPISPAKVSWTPLLKRKLRHRAAAGDIMPNLASEASALAAWLDTKVPSHQVPSAKTIENALRLDYASLRPRSNPIIP
ncbi:hypothetical protein [Muricoccus vinaceus]|uniref:Uncharacterized protein n=1 Tax=Muricoccus vinaceus TaxID=424704 RepID=A0ABV6ITV1_9PROT